MAKTALGWQDGRRRLLDVARGRGFLLPLVVLLPRPFVPLLVPLRPSVSRRGAFEGEREREDARRERDLASPVRGGEASRGLFLGARVAFLQTKVSESLLAYN